MKAVFAAMSNCTDELLDHWGIDVARHRERSRSVMPVSNPAKWMKSTDYPSEMLGKGQPGIVRRAELDADIGPVLARDAAAQLVDQIGIQRLGKARIGHRHRNALRLQSLGRKQAFGQMRAIA